MLFIRPKTNCRLNACMSMQACQKNINVQSKTDNAGCDAVTTTAHYTRKPVKCPAEGCYKLL